MQIVIAPNLRKILFCNDFQIIIFLSVSSQQWRRYAFFPSYLWEIGLFEIGKGTDVPVGFTALVVADFNLSYIN